jgi:hypothetical protein
MENSQGQETNQFAEEVGHAAVGDVRYHGINEEHPCHGIQQSFLSLIELEMLVPDSLLTDLDPRNSQDAFFSLQPASVQLVIRDDSEEDKPQNDGQESSPQEHSLPRRNRSPAFFTSFRDTVCNESSENLAPAAEAEPEVDAAALLIFCVPLRCQESEGGEVEKERRRTER